MATLTALNCHRARADSWYSIGFVVATGCLHLLGIAIGTVHKWAWGRRALQAAGGCVAMGGVYFLTQALG